jgi:hypothetical protein
MHEAFAAQTLANLKMFASDEFAQKKLGPQPGDWRSGHGKIQRIGWLNCLWVTHLPLPARA